MSRRVEDWITCNLLNDCGGYFDYVYTATKSELEELKQLIEEELNELKSSELDTEPESRNIQQQ